jgi:uncharacterized protein (DUF1330 family)
MKTRYVVALAVATFGLGAFATQGLHAQATAPIYVVTEIDVTDAAGFKTYADGMGVMIEKNGGKYIVRGGKVVATMDGAAPQRFTIYRFDSMAKFEAFQSVAKDAMATRNKVGKFRAFAVEGLAN